MTQKEKKLLIKDLCARLPYGVKGLITTHMTMGENITSNRVIDGELYGRFVNILQGLWYDNIPPIRPYLRPLSSMTEKEKEELKNATCPNGTGYFNEQYLACPVNHFGEQISYVFMADIIDWLVSHHFDFRGLIEKGLALEAPEGMYTKEDQQ